VWTADCVRRGGGGEGGRGRDGSGGEGSGGEGRGGEGRAGEARGGEGRRGEARRGREQMRSLGRWVASVQTHRVHADAGFRPHGRWVVSTRTLFLLRLRTVKTRPRVNRIRGVNADAGGLPHEKDVRTVIFIQKRPL
jgi:hypothetical protein